MIRGVLSDEIPKYWDELEVLIAKPLKRLKLEKYYTPEDVLWKCVQRDWQCWVYETDKIESVGITFIESYPTGYKRLVLLFVGGKSIAPYFEQAWELFKAFGQAHGCQEIAGLGRKAWPRLIKKYESNPVIEEYRFSVEI